MRVPLFFFLLSMVGDLRFFLSFLQKKDMETKNKSLYMMCICEK